MEQSPTAPPNTHNDIGLRFMLLGLGALAASLLFGVLGAFKFLYPEFIEGLAFNKLRPLHVSLAISWIFLTAIGGIYYYLPHIPSLSAFSTRVARWHFWIYLVTGLAILAAYALGRFGGREYWEFPPLLALPIFATWIMFGTNYFRIARQRRTAWPVYYWMWGTGIVFFFLTFTESYLWLIPYFRENMLREIAVQWKSYGSLVGSWNMLVYGTALYLMERISGDEGVARSKMAFGLYFLGLFNLMFGWAHHTYPVPFAAWVRDFAYLVSMTELFLLGKIIWDWRASLTALQKFQHRRPYRFLFASDMWVFANLVLALVISVPALNLFTHGTHVIVAHTMGTTIGINTMILLASVFYVLEQRIGQDVEIRHARPLNAGFWLANGSLLVFLAALLAAGLIKGTYDGGSFQEMMESIEPFLLVFAVAGVGLMIGFWLLLIPAMGHMSGLVFARRYDRIGARQAGERAAGD
ncbi:MAG: cbb3-type cytochrome c oxidase subunit I [Rhodospirillales bacterium]|nr:cbb3-type cytochrome c oxidase subunit I [Rhodospirillales bacterium]